MTSDLLLSKNHHRSHQGKPQIEGRSEDVPPPRHIFHPPLPQLPHITDKGQRAKFFHFPNLSFQDPYWQMTSPCSHLRSLSNLFGNHKVMCTKQSFEQKDNMEILRSTVAGFRGTRSWLSSNPAGH